MQNGVLIAASNLITSYATFLAEWFKLFRKLGMRYSKCIASYAILKHKWISWTYFNTLHDSLSLYRKLHLIIFLLIMYSTSWMFLVQIMHSWEQLEISYYITKLIFFTSLFPLPTNVFQRINFSPFWNKLQLPLILFYVLNKEYYLCPKIQWSFKRVSFHRSDKFLLMLRVCI